MAAKALKRTFLAGDWIQFVGVGAAAPAAGPATLALSWVLNGRGPLAKNDPSTNFLVVNGIAKDSFEIVSK